MSEEGYRLGEWVYDKLTKLKPMIITTHHFLYGGVSYTIRYHKSDGEPIEEEVIPERLRKLSDDREEQNR